MKRQFTAAIVLVLVIMLVIPSACRPKPAEITKPAEYEVSALTISPTELMSGEESKITAEVKNIGGSEGSYAATLRIDGADIETRTVIVAAGATETIVFTVIEDIPGNYRVELDGLSGTFKVLKPAEFEVSSLTIMPSEVAAGEKATVKVSISNVGEIEGTYKATLTVDGAEIETKEVTLDGGSKETVSFAISEGATGTYNVKVNGLTGTLKVLKPAELEASRLTVTPTLVLPGQEATVEADVTNVGQIKGDLKATLTVNGVETDTRPLTLDPGAPDTASFTVIRDLPGTYELSVAGQSVALTIPEVETYNSDIYLYSISYPSEWTIREESPELIYFVKSDIAGIGVQVNLLSPIISQQEFLELSLENLEQSVEDFKLFLQEEIKENGTTVGHAIDYEYTILGIKWKGCCLLMKRGRYGFAITGDAREPVYEINRPLLDACLESFQPPVVAEGSYADEIHGFSLTLPTGWDGLETEEPSPLLRIENPAEEPIIFAYVYLEHLFEDTTAQEFASNTASLWSEEPRYRIVSEGEISLGEDTSGYEVTFTYNENSYSIKRQVVSVIRGTQAFTTIIYTLASTFGEERNTINQFVRGFTLEEPKPFGVSRQMALFLLWGEIVTLDPALFEGSPKGIVGAIFSGLVRLDRDLKVVPDIAESWEVSGDGTVYTFHLREGVKFHDGKQLTAHDFKYSWERACDPETGSKKALFFLGDIVGAKEMLDEEATELSGVKVIDEATLEVTIDGPKPYFLDKLAYPTAYIVDRSNVARGMNWTDNPNGTGPFKLKEWKKDELLILERNDDYYLEPAKLESVVLQIFAGRPMMMYERGEIDVSGVGLYDLERVLDPADPLNEELLTTPSISMSYLGFNVTKPPFDDPKVRRSFALALDMDKILEVSLKGIAEGAGGYIPPGIPGHNEELELLPFDPDLARQLIAESKYGSVDNFPSIVFYDLYSLGPDVEAMIGMWQANLGVTVEAQIIEEREEMLEMRHNRELQIFVSGWTADYIDPQNFLEVLFHSQSEDNDSAYSNPEVDAALEKAGVERDEKERLKMYQDIEKMILEDLPVVPFYQSPKKHTLVKPYVEGYYLAPIGIHIWKDISIKSH